MKKRQKITVLICVLLVILIPVSVLAVSGMKSGDTATGTFERKIIDRINIAVTGTEFELKKADGGKYVISFTFKAEKTEPDFYAMLNSLDVEGLDYESIVFSPLNDNCSGNELSGSVLPVKNGKTVPIEYRADVTFSSAKTKLSPVLVLVYTSGMTQLTSDMHRLEIPLSVKIK